MSNYRAETLQNIFDRTDGLCHLCHQGMCFGNYGQQGRRGAWEVEHSVPRVNGGTDNPNNLYAAHISCNRSKGTFTSRTARGWHGRKRAPLSADRKDQARWGNAALLGTFGGIVTLALAPEVVLVGAVASAIFGYSLDPNNA